MISLMLFLWRNLRESLMLRLLILLRIKELDLHNLLHFVTHTLTNLIPFMPYTPSLGSNGPYSLVLGIHFMTRVTPTMVRREHNNEISKFRVDTDREIENTTILSLARKEWL